MFLFIINDTNRKLPGVSGTLPLTPLLTGEDVMVQFTCLSLYT